MKNLEIFISEGSGKEKLYISFRNGHKTIIDIEKILYCEADGNYTSVVSEESIRNEICRSLCKLEELLKHHDFLRIHNSYMVNLGNVKSFYRDRKKWFVIVADQNLPVSRRYNDIIPVLIDFGIKETKNNYRLINSLTGYTVK